MQPLPSVFQPLAVTIQLPCSQTVIADAQEELRTKAKQDDYKCFGYFPGMSAKGTSLDFDLPKCKLFAQRVPELTVNDRVCSFGFLRMSLIQQPGISPYHVDSDASAALTGDMATLSKKRIWRLLFNLSDTYARTLSYLDVDPSTVKLDIKNGYIHYPNQTVTKKAIHEIVIPPRQGTRVEAVLFCASRVLHAGKDDEHGHYVAGYGCEG
ncbi:MAG TPA: hypothetical protein VMY99_01095 [Nevskiaceae bacterium]|nr:hypothetical protein [Nevskiaceae bacterium]